MNKTETEIDAIKWLILARIKVLKEYCKTENDTIKIIIKNTSIKELKHLLKLINLRKKNKDAY